MTEEPGIPEHWFERADSAPDEMFYSVPRMVAHIDQATIDALTRFYEEFIPANARVLDLMSSWISHLPEDTDYRHVSGLGMNAEELNTNPRLNDWCVHNLNENPALPYSEGTFDRALIAVSIQYLTRPVDVMKSIASVLSPGGRVCIAMSHRCFPTKAIAAFQRLPARDRIRLVMFYLENAGFEEVEFIDRSPEGADPLWLVVGTAPG